jgi:hypothetical protein
MSSTKTVIKNLRLRQNLIAEVGQTPDRVLRPSLWNKIMTESGIFKLFVMGFIFISRLQ